MQLKHISIEAPYLSTLAWHGNDLVDWASAGTVYTEQGESEKRLAKYRLAYSFDAAIVSPCKKYVLIYKRLDTKALLLKDGEVLREINRSYYHAETYEYPAVFAKIKGTLYLIHCPLDYCRLDIEEVESGKIVSDVPGRKPDDVFHSRLQISPDGKYLLDSGWVWQPWDIVELYDLEVCLENPLLLDNSSLSPSSFVTSEFCCAGFLNSSTLVLATSSEIPDEDEEVLVPPHSFVLWDLEDRKLRNPVTPEFKVGNFVVLNDQYLFDWYEFPKLIQLETGKVIQSFPEIATSQQNSSIAHQYEDLPKVAYNQELGRIALHCKGRIEVFQSA